MEIWAHRGCSYKYPENTIEAFTAAMNIDGLFGIELDVQEAKDGEIVVIHDEKLDRTTTMVGYVKDWPYSEYQKYTSIPSLKEVLELLRPKMEEGLMLNIELKNSVIRYEGMEEKVLNIVKYFGLLDKVIFSSFNSDSMLLMRELEPDAKVACLGNDILDCLNDATYKVHANAIHPYIKKISLPIWALEDMDVRVWTKDPLYPHTAFMREHNLRSLENKGITGIFVNNPEDYLKKY